MLVKFQTSKGNSTYLGKDVFALSPIPDVLHEPYCGTLALFKEKSSALGSCTANQQPPEPQERSV